MRSSFVKLLLPSAIAGSFACSPSLSPSPPAPPGPAREQTSPLTSPGQSGSTLWPGSSPVPVVPHVPALAPPAPPKLAAPLKSQDAKRELDRIRPYCAPAVAIDGLKERVGCACCPPFELCPPLPNAALVEQPEVFALRNSVEGAFSAPGEEEAALTFEGCESHANNRGGTLLVKKNDPKKADYRSGLNPSECKKLSDSKRAIDLLLCQHRALHQGIGHSVVFVYDFTKKDLAAVIPLFDALDNAMSACAGAPEGYPVVQIVVKSVAASDTNGDGRADVTVSALVRKGSVTPAYAALCEKWSAWSAQDARDPKSEPTQPWSTLPPGKPISLTFMGKPEGKLEPSDATKKAIAQMVRELDAFDGPP